MLFWPEKSFLSAAAAGQSAKANNSIKKNSIVFNAIRL
jgi:hypothetical protein